MGKGSRKEGSQKRGERGEETEEKGGFI